MACPPDENALILSQLSLASTIGIGYIGVALSSMIYGVTCIQTFQYFRTPRASADIWYLKLTVIALWLLDTVHQAIIIETLYHYVIINYANAVALLRTTWSIPTEIIFNAIIAFIVETFFVVRIWKLSKNLFVSGTCMLFTLAHITMNLLFPIRIFFYPILVEAETKLKSTGSAGLGVAVVADVSISAAMVWYLRRGRTGLRKSDDIIGRLVMLTITTGSLTTLFVIATLIAYLAAPEQLWNLCFNFMVGKLYINSVLTSLNSRGYVRGGAEASVRVNTFPLSPVHTDRGDGSRTRFDMESTVPVTSDLKNGYVV
ncbi:hypothetical protein BD413DRAFT_595732 [Trametes elegans]|nr:hypothetical protein BD413DRAFT_595732 [Trametes elegans]